MDCKFKTDLGTVTVNEEVLLKIASYTALGCYGIVAMASKSAKDGLIQLWLSLIHIYAAVGEYVLDRAYRDYVLTGAYDQIQHRIAGHFGRKVAPVAGAGERARLAHERSRYDPAHAQVAGQQPARDATVLPELCRGHDPLVCGHLEYAVGGGVDYQLAGAQVLRAQALDYLGARGRLVAQHAASGAPAELCLLYTSRCV